MKEFKWKTDIARNIFYQKYALTQSDTWPERCRNVIEDVCGTMNGRRRRTLSESECERLLEFMIDMKFMPGGRYIYYAGRRAHYFNNCFMLKAENDTREEWASLAQKSTSCLMVGGGIGVDYSIIRPSGRSIMKTGGVSSGPISLMEMINEIGRNVIQGGSRRSAIYASLNWLHGDAEKLLTAKDWDSQSIPGLNGLTVGDLKKSDFNYKASLDMTNISLNYDDKFLKELENGIPKIFKDNVRMALKTGEPGFSFNFGKKENETLRNAPVSKDTHVLTESGYCKIADIVDKKVKIWTGKQFAETTFKKTKENADIVKIGITGGRIIKADPMHEFFVERLKWSGGKRKSKIKKIAAGNLRINDRLVFSPPNIIKRTSERDYIMGYAYGDGSFNKHGGEITFCTDDSISCYSYMNKKFFRSVNLCDSRGYVRAYFGKDFANSKDRSKNVFPKEMYSSPSFIAGLFDANGSYDRKQDMIKLSSVHYSFLEDVRRSLDCIGIMSTINKAGHTTFSNRQAYSLVIMRSYSNTFKNNIPVNRLKIEGRMPFRESVFHIESISDSYPEDVYCCDVGVKEHSFMAEGIIISNCCELTSEDDSDVCNLGSVNMGAVESIDEFKEIVNLASKFLISGTLRADLPYKKVHEVREKNRRIGLGLMGVHEWLLKKEYKYEINDELRSWMQVYKDESEKSANDHCDRLYLNRPAGYRAIAPTGTIGILSSTSTGIEPIYAVAYKRRYLVNGNEWKYEYVVDNTAKNIISEHGVDPLSIESAIDLAKDYERRIKFQADIQDYVDHAISSTINIPAWGSEFNNEDMVDDFAKTLAKYAPRLRGFTCYPDGGRGGQPITSVPYEEAVSHSGEVFSESHDICEISSRGGTCGS